MRLLLYRQCSKALYGVVLEDLNIPIGKTDPAKRDPAPSCKINIPTRWKSPKKSINGLRCVESFGVGNLEEANVLVLHFLDFSVDPVPQGI